VSQARIGFVFKFLHGLRSGRAMQKIAQEVASLVECVLLFTSNTHTVDFSVSGVNN